MWKNNKDVVPTQEAMQKMIEFYHQKEIDMLNLGCTLHNLANICLHKSTDSKFYPFTESDKDLLEKMFPEDSQRLEIWSNIWLHVASKWSTSIQKKYTS